MKTIAFNVSNDTKRLKCEEISPIKISINSNKFCFTLFSQLNEESDERYLIDYDMKTRAFSHILMEFSIPLEEEISLIYIHSRIESVTEEPKPYPTIINVENGVMSAIRFRKTRAELMPKPYKTSCFDYKNIGYNSRSDCIFKCKVDNYVRNLSRWPKKYYTDDRESELLMAESGYESMDSKLSDKCREFCGENNDCFG
jgi:hypothetical protein